MRKESDKNSPLDAALAQIESIFLWAVIAPILPILCGLAGWWGSIPFVPEAQIKYFALGGLLTGLLAGALFLKRWVRGALKMPLVWPALAYMFYSVGTFGFFMGVPAFNLLLGPAGGYYMGMRLRAQGAGLEATERAARLTALFTASILAAACLGALALAWMDQSLAVNIQGMFGLRNPLNRDAILGLSAAAGAALVWIEYAVTRAVVRFARGIR